MTMKDAMIANTAQKHYDLSGPDMAVIAATINKQTATRNLLIPLLAEHLETSTEIDDLHDVFLKTTEELRKHAGAQVPEYRSTMKYKLCLKNIFSPDTEY